jgi:hypothetical protein
MLNVFMNKYTLTLEICKICNIKFGDMNCGHFKPP